VFLFRKLGSATTRQRSKSFFSTHAGVYLLTSNYFVESLTVPSIAVKESCTWRAFQQRVGSDCRDH